MVLISLPKLLVGLKSLEMQKCSIEGANITLNDQPLSYLFKNDVVEGDDILRDETEYWEDGNEEHDQHVDHLALSRARVVHQRSQM